MDESKLKSPDDHQAQEETKPPVFPFTIYSDREKFVLMLLLSLIGFWSTLSSPIYFPALPTISEKFDISAGVTDLSVVAYLVFQGVMPTFSSTFADTFGRRPVIMASMLVYIGACVALSQTNVYWLLAVLRCVQAAGIGPVIAISSGVSGDVCTAADRGGFVGTVAGLQLTGNAFGGLVGAALIDRFTWRGIFIFLAIGSGVTLCFIAIVLPETLRLIVGNGSILPKNFINRTPIFLLDHYKARLSNDTPTLAPLKKIDLLKPFRMLVHLEIVCILLPPALKFSIWTMALTSLTLLEGDGYNYTVLQVGFIYLPQGVFCFLGSMVTGKLLNYSYKHFKNRHDKKYQDVPEDDRPKFNLLQSRVFVSIIPCILMFIGTIIYGWCLQHKQNIASIIISSSLMAYSSTSFISICTTIMVDIHPNNASTSASLMNLFRCCLAGLCTGVLSKMTSSMGLGGCYTFWGCLDLFANGLLICAVKLSKDKLHDKK